MKHGARALAGRRRTGKTRIRFTLRTLLYGNHPLVLAVHRRNHRVWPRHWAVGFSP